MSDQQEPLENQQNFYHRVGEAILACQVDEKLTMVDRLLADFRQGKLIREDEQNLFNAEQAGFPDQPEMVEPADLPRRSFKHEQGRIAFLHAIVHIEFNAINLALDAAFRFREFPDQYYQDWLQVAEEEVKHFRLLAHRLAELGSQYGAMSAHRGLWDMSEKTQNNALERMALVPRYLEAKGLDVTPAMIVKLRKVEDHASADILEIILHDEVGHVRIGSRWFAYLCDQQKQEPIEHYFHLLGVKLESRLRGPFNHELRKQAGFSDRELEMLEQLAEEQSTPKSKLI